jgi:hypothetical protein
MKKTVILGLTLVGLAIGATNIVSASSEKYPASAFEPTVIYSDNDAIEQASNAAEKSEVDAKYPAAHFEPTVVYIDKALAEQAEEDKFDAKYPAAYFTPKVIYP